MKLFGRNPARKLRASYEAKLKEARDLQRRGDIQRYAAATAEAEEIAAKIAELES